MAKDSKEDKKLEEDTSFKTQEKTEKVAEAKVAAKAEVSVAPVAAPRPDKYRGKGGCYVIGEDGVKRRVTE